LESAPSSPPTVTGCSLPDDVKQKPAFQHTFFSNNKWFCLEIKRWKSTLSYLILSSYFISYFEMLGLIWSDFIGICTIQNTLHELVNNFLSITIFQDPQGGLRGQIMEGLCRLKKHTRVLGCSVSDVVKQKSAFQHIWISNNKGFCLETTC